MGKVLVTGGCGFVGRHVVLRLLTKGEKVWAVDDLSTGTHPKEWLPEKYMRSDIFTFVHDDVRRFFARYFCSDRYEKSLSTGKLPEFDDVFHFAGVVGGRAKIEGDPIAVATDLAIDSDFFAWAVKIKPDRVLYASSSAAYPIQMQRSDGAVALKEEFIGFGGQLGQPDMTYGWSKLTGEYLARISADNYNLHVVCVRPFSGYGEDQDETYPIPTIAARAVRREDPFIIWGSGEQGRDFVHIEDCVDAMFLALEKIRDGSAINIGSGILMTFKEVAKVFISFAGYKPVIKPLVDKPTGVHSRYSNIEKAKTVLGWQPEITVEEGFRRVYDYVCQRSQGRVHKKAIEFIKTI